MTGRVDTTPADKADSAPKGVRGFRARVTNFRTRVRSSPVGRIVWRVAVTVAGIAVIAVGIVLLPLPGPGWLIIFAGLGLLGTEYAWAARLLTWLRDLVLRWTRWVTRQGTLVRIGLLVVSLLFLAGVAVGCWYLYKLM
jgi:uncharacterized protein (TIGR02611 family)